jgi:hypothetical protein
VAGEQDKSWVKMAEAIGITTLIMASVKEKN